MVTRYYIHGSDYMQLTGLDISLFGATACFILAIISGLVDDSSVLCKYWTFSAIIMFLLFIAQVGLYEL